MSRVVFFAASAVVAVVLLASAGAASAHDPYTYTASPGNFTVSNITLSTSTGKWTAGAVATVTTQGVSNKVILAGVVKYRIYEQYQYHFVASGDLDFFHCTNKGCNPSDPLALKLDHPNVAPSDYTLTFTFKMPAITKPGNDQFKILFWCEDQDHSPYDMSATIQYNLETSTDDAVAAPARVAVPMEDPYTVQNQNKYFTIDEVHMMSENGHWEPGHVASVHAFGRTHKKITDGTIKYQLWEGYEQHFIASGAFNYFHCTIKSCDPSSPISLFLHDPERDDSKLEIKFDFLMMKPEAGGDNQFRLVYWGEDQDHYPYDFSTTITFNTTSASL